jgi:hypothetical protein
MKQANATPQRKPYRKPELREYGDLRRLTETDIAGSGTLDGGSYGMTLLKTAG